MKKDLYKEQASYLIKAIDIAIDSFKKFPPKDFLPEHVIKIINTYLDFRHEVLNPEEKFRTITSLKYSINDVFIFFQETGGVTVNFFWQEVNKMVLPYKRENKLQKILKRGKIKTQIEYDFIIDVLVPYQQEGLINNEDSLKIKILLTEFEKLAPKS